MNETSKLLPGSGPDLKWNAYLRDCVVDTGEHGKSSPIQNQIITRVYRTGWLL